MIKAIENKELKVNDLAGKYGCSDRTIQVKIKGLGFQWDSKEVRYTFNGKDLKVLELDIDEVFTKKVTGNKISNPTNNSGSKKVNETGSNKVGIPEIQEVGNLGSKKVGMAESHEVGKKKVTYEIEEWLHDEIRIRSIREKRNVSDIVNDILKAGLV